MKILKNKMKRIMKMKRNLIMKMGEDLKKIRKKKKK